MAVNPPSRRVPLHVHVHGSQAFLARVTPLLPPDVEASPTSTAEDLALALSSQVGCVVVADQADLAPAGSVAQVIASARRDGSGPPLLALDCADTAAVATALAAGAMLALRADASLPEIASAVHALARDKGLERLVSLLRLDLEHQRLLLMKDDLTAAGGEIVT